MGRSVEVADLMRAVEAHVETYEREIASLTPYTAAEMAVDVVLHALALSDIIDRRDGVVRPLSQD